AAQLLGVEPARAVVYEDAVSGVRAGAAGGFGAVIGVDRGAGAAELADAGATGVVADLEEVSGAGVACRPPTPSPEPICTPTSGAMRRATAPSSTAPTRRGRSTTPNPPSASPARARR